MIRSTVVLCAVLVIVGTARPASADWLLTGFVAPIFNVKTSEATDLLVPAEEFDSSVGFGVNLASAFASRGNLGFELDWGWYPNGLKTSDVFGTAFASRLMSLSTNFFYSPALSPVRPYFSVGPNFAYRSNRDEALIETPSGWAVGINGGGGVMAFLSQRFGVRGDFRYYRNLSDFIDLRPGAEQRRSGWKDLQFLRVFFGATVVL